MEPQNNSFLKNHRARIIFWFGIILIIGSVFISTWLYVTAHRDSLVLWLFLVAPVASLGLMLGTILIIFSRHGNPKGDDESKNNYSFMYVGIGAVLVAAIILSMALSTAPSKKSPPVSPSRGVPPVSTPVQPSQPTYPMRLYERESTSTIYLSSCKDKEIVYIKNRPMGLVYSTSTMTLSQFQAKYPGAVEIDVLGDDVIHVFCDQQGRIYMTLAALPYSKSMYYLYGYDPQSGETHLYLNSLGLPEKMPIPIPVAVSNNGEFLTIRKYSCFQCDAYPGPYMIINTRSGFTESIGKNYPENRYVDFEWLDDNQGSYRYKSLSEFPAGECPFGRMSEFDGSCYKNSSEVPFIYGKFARSVVSVVKEPDSAYWLDYSNQKYGYSLKLPLEAKLGYSSVNTNYNTDMWVLPLSIPRADSHKEFTISVDSSDTNICLWESMNPGKNPNYPAPIVGRLIGQKIFNVYDDYAEGGTETTGYIRNYDTYYEGKCYSMKMYLYGPGNNNQTVPNTFDFDVEGEVIEKIISTFKF